MTLIDEDLTLNMMTLNPHQLWTKCNIKVNAEILTVNLVEAV